MTGVMTSAPATSPSHHVVHMEPNLAGGAYPAAVKLLTPIVADTDAHTRLIRVNRVMPPGVSNVRGPSDQRLIK